MVLGFENWFRRWSNILELLVILVLINAVQFVLFIFDMHPYNKITLATFLCFLLAVFRYWDLRQSTPVHTQQLGERCYAMTVRYPLMVVGTADRNMVVYNLQNPQVMISDDPEFLNCFTEMLFRSPTILYCF